MYAVFRETIYPEGKLIQKDDDFKKFQDQHAKQRGYIGTMVSNVGDGIHLTITLWKTKENMNSARRVLEPVVKGLLNPMMTSPAKLLGTGPVVINDLELKQKL